MTKPTDPHKRLGVFKTLDDVPQRYRLQQYAAEFEERDVWDEWMATRDLEESTETRIGRAEDSWKEHMAARDRHHALARPSDVEMWCAALLERMNTGTLYNRYYGALSNFYEWLVWHWEYPHRYSPVLMAVLDGGATAQAYEQKITQGLNREVTL